MRSLFFVLMMATSLEAAQRREYHAIVTSEERGHIDYIVRTLASTSFLQMAFLGRDLEERREKIKQLHPFKFLEIIFLDRELKICMCKIKDRSWVWSRFCSGISKSFQEEANIDNLKEHIESFACTVQAFKEVLEPPLHKQDWKGFMEALMSPSSQGGVM